jgi:hypothetical protein
MQGIYTYIPETNHVSKEYDVAAILSLLFIIIIIIIIKLKLGWYPVAVVYIYTQTVHRIQRTEHT